MKALTICQPYAHLIAIGEKLVENRRWRLRYRGELLIHAGKSRSWMEPGDEDDYPDMAFGAIVAQATVVDCCSPVQIPSRHPHLIGHEHVEGPWCIVLENVRRLRFPQPATGERGLWDWPGSFAAACFTNEREADRG